MAQDATNELSLAVEHYNNGEYEQAIRKFQDAVQLAQTCGNIQQQAIGLSNLGAAQGQVGEYSAACATLQKALVLWRQMKDHKGECQALISLGTALEHVYRYSDALQSWLGALELARTMYDRKLAEIALKGSADCHSKLKHHDDAITQYQKLLGYYEKNNDEENLIDVLMDLARVELDRGNTQQAETHVQKALYLARKRNDLSKEAYCLYKMGSLYLHTGFNQEGRDLLSSAVTSYRKTNDPADLPRLGAALNDLGMAYDRLGMFQDGLTAFQEALQIAEQTGDKVNQGGTYHGMGYLYQQIGQFEEALSYYEKALRLTEEGGDWHAASFTLTNLGVVHFELKHYQEARSFLEKALQMQEAAGDLLAQGHTLISIAACYHHNDEIDRAIQTYHKALEIQQRTGDRDAQAGTLTNMGEALLRKKEYKEAIQYKQRALEIFHKIQNPVGQIQTLYSLARILAVTGDLARSVVTLDDAVKLIENMRVNLLSESMRTSYFSHVHDIYAMYVDALLLMNRREDAFRMVERGKARSFLDLLAEAQDDFRAELDPHLQKEEQQLLEQMDAVRIQLDAIDKEELDAEKQHRMEDLKSQQQDLERRYQILQAEIRQQNPRYAALTQPAVWGIQQVQRQLLDDHTALLEYTLGEYVSVLFVVLKDSFEIFRLPPRSQIETQVRELRASLSLHRYAHGDVLYHQLVNPAEALIRGKDLLIVADGALHYLPFALLLTASPEEGQVGENVLPTSFRSDRALNEEDLLTQTLEKQLASLPPFDFANLPYLLREHTIRYAPSASVAGVIQKEAQAKQKPFAAQKQMVAMADPLVEGQKPSSVALRSMRGEPAPLPYTADEVWTLAELFDQHIPPSRSHTLDTPYVQLFTGPEATKRKIMELTSGKSTYRFLHIATHGLLNMDEPQFSGLLFSPEGGQDNYWKTFEIFQSHIPADTVVLSACETGLGKVVRGEGLIGLTRAFLYAGAARVCVSLWKVADVSTPDLMRFFYQSMLQGQDAATSLRTAQLQLLEEGVFTHPFYWGAFVMVGSD